MFVLLKLFVKACLFPVRLFVKECLFSPMPVCKRRVWFGYLDLLNAELSSKS